MPDDQPPRRRIADRDRRQWSDARLTERHEAIDRRLHRLEEFQRVMAQVPGMMEAIREAQDEQGKDIREQGQDMRDMRARMDKNFDRNFAEHREVKTTAETIKAQTAPSRWSKVKDFATIVSLLLVPILAAYVAARGGR